MGGWIVPGGLYLVVCAWWFVCGSLCLEECVWWWGACLIGGLFVVSGRCLKSSVWDSLFVVMSLVWWMAWLWSIVSEVLL